MWLAGELNNDGNVLCMYTEWCMSSPDPMHLHSVATLSGIVSHLLTEVGGMSLLHGKKQMQNHNVTVGPAGKR